MTDAGKVLASADRAAARKLVEVEYAAQAAMRESNAKGMLNSGGHLQQCYRICVEGFRNLCDAAAIRIAEIEGEAASSYAEKLRAPLLVHQLAIDRAFKNFGAPGNSPVMDERMLPAFHDELDNVLQETLDDLALGIAGGVNVSSRKGNKVLVDTGGGAAQVMVDSPNGTQHVGGDQTGRSSFDAKELVTLLSGLRQELEASTVSPQVREELEDAIVNVEREVASAPNETSRLKRLTRKVIGIGDRVLVGVSTSFLGRLAQWLAGL